MQQYEEYVPQFQRWAEEVLRVTGQSSLQELMQNYDGQAEDGVDNAQLFEPSVGEMPLEAGTEEQQDEAEATAAAESVQTATDEAPAEWETAPAELATAPEAVPSDVAGTHEAPQIEAAAVELEPSEMGDEESPAVPQQPTSTNTVTHMSRQLPSVPRAQLRASPSRLTVFEEPATTAAPTGPAAQAAQPRKVVVLKRSNPAPRSPLAINRGGVIAMYSPNTNVPSQ